LVIKIPIGIANGIPRVFTNRIPCFRELEVLVYFSILHYFYKKIIGGLNGQENYVQENMSTEETRDIKNEDIPAVKIRHEDGKKVLSDVGRIVYCLLKQLKSKNETI